MRERRLSRHLCEELPCLPYPATIGSWETAQAWATVQSLHGDSGMLRAVTTIVLSAFLASSGGAWAQPKSGKGGGFEQLTLFNEAFERIRQDSVEPVAEGKLIGAAIAGMLSGLDARSA